jgi:hypothetical protein
MADDKITILKLINDNKEILFGKFSSSLTHEIKTKKWMEITEKAKAIGIYEKDWKYLRDTTWQNWRKRTIVSIISICIFVYLYGLSNYLISTCLIQSMKPSQ